MSQRGKAAKRSDEKTVEMTEKQKNMLKYGKKHAKKTGTSPKSSTDPTAIDPRRLAMEKIDQSAKVDVSRVTLADITAGNRRDGRRTQYLSKNKKTKRGAATSHAKDGSKTLTTQDNYQDVDEAPVKPARKPRAKKAVADVAEV
jgi:hypothetical protein